jgi:hypothetical protein
MNWTGLAYAMGVGGTGGGGAQGGGFAEKVVTLEIAEKIRVKVGRGYIAGTAAQEPEPSKK